MNRITELLIRKIAEIPPEEATGGGYQDFILDTLIKRGVMAVLKQKT